MFLLALEWGGTKYAWHSATVIGLFCGSGGNLAIFLAWEYKRGDTAMIPLGMVKQRIIWTSCVVMFFFGGALLISSYYLAIYFQAVRGVTPLLSGVYLLPSILSQMVMAVLSGFLGSYCSKQIRTTTSWLPVCTAELTSASRSSRILPSLDDK